MNTYSVKQVADMLKTNPETVRRWIRSGKLIAQQDSRKGGNIIYESALREFVKTTPKYASTTAALLLGTAAISTAFVGGLVASKIAAEEQLTKAHISAEDIEKFILAEIESKRKAISTKKKTILQLETEVHDEEKKVSELQSLLENLKSDSVGGVENEQ